MFKRTGSRIQSILLAGFLATTMIAGCETVEADNDTVVTGDADCAAVCAALMSANCFYGGGEADCNTSCNGWDQMYAAKGQDCKDAWTSYKECIVVETIPTCGGVATYNVMPCRGEWDHSQNYCLYNATPAEACIANAAFDPFCASTAYTKKGMVCRGDVPTDCVIGGTSSNADLYCCP
jgi:hypothetical protein